MSAPLRFPVCPEQGKSCGECVRSLLCPLCNKGLGSFKDDPDLLIAAAMYLVQHKEVVCSAVASE